MMNVCMCGKACFSDVVVGVGEREHRRLAGMDVRFAGYMEGTQPAQREISVGHN